MLQLSDAEKAVEGERLKAAWYAGFEAARHHPQHTEPELVVRWKDNTPICVPRWRRGQHRPGWIS